MATLVFEVVAGELELARGVDNQVSHQGTVQLLKGPTEEPSIF